MVAAAAELGCSAALLIGTFMPRQENILSVFVASPSDVASERARLEEAVDELNASWSRLLGIRLELVRWETHTYPGTGDDPQAVINAQIPDDYDIFLGIMWHRFGTPTGRAGSGTHEEFLRAKARWDRDKLSVHIMVYFKDAPVSPSQVDAAQLGKVTEFRQSLGQEGVLYWSFNATDEFINFARMHLTKVVQAWHAKFVGGGVPQVHSKIAVEAAALPSVPVDENDVGLIELSEQFEDAFEEAGDVLVRLAKSTELVGKRMTDHSRRIENAKLAGTSTKASAKRMIEKTANHMNEYAAKLDQDIPTLGNLMSTGLGALSQAISLWPDVGQDPTQREQLEASIAGMQSLRQTICSVQGQITEFRQTVDAMPRLTTELNKAKRAVKSALQKEIDLLQSQQQILIQTEKSAIALLGKDPGFAATSSN